EPPGPGAARVDHRLALDGLSIELDRRHTAAPQAEPGRAPALEEAAPRRAPEAGEDLAVPHGVDVAVGRAPQGADHVVDTERGHDPRDLVGPDDVRVGETVGTLESNALSKAGHILA